MISLLLVLIWRTDMKCLVVENRINQGTFLCEMNGKLTHRQYLLVRSLYVFSSVRSEFVGMPHMQPET